MKKIVLSMMLAMSLVLVGCSSDDSDGGSLVNDNFLPFSELTTCEIFDMNDATGGWVVYDQLASEYYEFVTARCTSAVQLTQYKTKLIQNMKFTDADWGTSGSSEYRIGAYNERDGVSYEFSIYNTKTIDGDRIAVWGVASLENSEAFPVSAE
jgi:hypothetical protein